MTYRRNAGQARDVRRFAMWMGVSALAMATSTVAAAQCAPNQPTTGADIVCSGEDVDGLTVTASGTRTRIETGALVRGQGDAAIRYAMPVSAVLHPSLPRRAWLQVDGRIEGGNWAGISLEPGPSVGPFFYQGSTFEITTGTGSSIGGDVGILLRSTPDNPYERAFLTLDNAGVIEGASGLAIHSLAPDRAGLTKLINRSSGVIGAIDAPLGVLDNAGLIDGGNRSAIVYRSNSSYFSTNDWYNSGIIQSNSSVATIVDPPIVLHNGGIIRNIGSGPAIEKNSLYTGLIIDNQAGGLIATAGSTAIKAYNLHLSNAGRIEGDIITTSNEYYGGSRIDSHAGTIVGNVRFGGSSDTLVAGLDANGQIVYGITGTIDGGLGNDALELFVDRDVALLAAPTLPTGFEILRLAPQSDITLSLAGANAWTQSIELSGSGLVVNKGNMIGSGQFIRSSFAYGNAEGVFQNDGTINTTIAAPTGEFAINVDRFVNNGSVDLAGDGVKGDLINHGDVTASGLVFSTFSGEFDNEGTIRSRSGQAVSLWGSSYTTWRNAGLIEAPTTAAVVQGTLNNSGTISGGNIGVSLSGTLNNQAGGVVSSAGTAVRVTRGSLYNEGVIRGNVLFDGDPNGYNYGADRLFLVPGGIIYGNVQLGAGTVLITDLVGTENGRFAGVNGTVSATQARLRLRVEADAAARMDQYTGFDELGYQLVNDAKLTLTGGTVTANRIVLAGVGSVDLTADLTARRLTALQTERPILPIYDFNAVTRLDIQSHGTLRITRATSSDASYLAYIGQGSSFTNSGTIVASDLANLPYYSPVTGISGNADRVVNRGSMILTRAVGVSGATEFVNEGIIDLTDASAVNSVGLVENSGNIFQRGQTGAPAALAGIRSLSNSGTIDTQSVAISFNYDGVVDNSGRITSSTNAAIMGTSLFGNVTNQIGGIIGGATTAIRLQGGTIRNAGTINGNVDLAYSIYGYPFTFSGSFIDEGGTLNGSLTFGAGSDLFLQMGDATGVTGTIDGGDGFDIYGRQYGADASVQLGSIGGINFEQAYIGADAGATVNLAAGAYTGDVALGGNGRIENHADITGQVSTYLYSSWDNALAPLGALDNKGTITGALRGYLGSLTNSGTIKPGDNPYGAVVSQAWYGDEMRFDNSGSISGAPRVDAVSLSAEYVDSITIANSGTINGSMDVRVLTGDSIYALAFANSGTIRTDIGSAFRLTADNYYYFGGAGLIDIANSGTIETAGQSAGALVLTGDYYGLTADVKIHNGGTISANGGGQVITGTYWPGIDYIYTAPASAIRVDSFASPPVSIINASDGVIEATGGLSTTIIVHNAGLTLDNAGTIRGDAGGELDANDQLALFNGTTYRAGAIQTFGDTVDTITNSGTIIGSVDLGFGDDVIVNRGTIEGDVFLRDGDDSFTQLASAILKGTVDGGAGVDSFIVDATGGGAINADQFVNFERFFQIGQGNVVYSGDFSFDTIGLDGGTVTVAAGETLTSTSATTITGGSGKDSVINAGTIGGGIDLAGGDDSVVNRGVIAGPVSLGAGNDSFTEQVGSGVAGIVDGGAGNDVYRVVLAGNRNGLGPQVGFERLAVEGSGSLALSLGQDYEAISLAGTGLTLDTNGFFVGQIAGSDAQEQAHLINEVGSVQLGGGNDALVFDPNRMAGRYDGGAGKDSLTFTAQGPVTLLGTLTGFESISLGGGSLTVVGQLGSADGALAFGDTADTLDIVAGGRLLGSIDMGGGNDIVSIADSAQWQGILSGGTGTDSLSLALGAGRTLDGSHVLGFETVAVQGSGALTLATNGSIVADMLRFGAGDNRFTINGLFAGSVDGGAGDNRILLGGGTVAAPVRFGAVSNIAGMDVTGGYATVSGVANFGAIDMTAGYLVGLAGSTIRSSGIQVRRGATFGSAGTVVGNITVAGTLSPGSSPGTMTVNGNVALAGGSTTLMEIAPTVADQLLISGTLSIAQGSNLVLTTDQQVKPGRSLDLIIASGGITGSFTNIVKSNGMFGVIVQDQDSISLLGQFLNSGNFTPQVQRAIDYTNAVILGGTAGNALIDALPALATASGDSNPAAFARVTAEPYASATQVGVENGLAIAGAARNLARLSADETPRAFGIGQYLGGLGRLAADAGAGLSASRSRSNGLLGGLGIGTDRWSIAGFGGYLDTRQSLRQLGSQTDADGWFSGITGRYALGALQVNATLGYHQFKANADRLTPDAKRAQGRFRLKSWIGDLSLSYEAKMGGDWAIQPDIGLTYVATTRTGLTESGSVWALDVAEDKHDALFADSGLSFGRGRDSTAAFRPFVRLGVQYQLQGRGVEALAGFAGLPLDLLSLGARRSALVGSVSGGGEMRISSALSLFATASQSYSEDDRRASANVGLKLAF